MHAGPAATDSCWAGKLPVCPQERAPLGCSCRPARPGRPHTAPPRERGAPHEPGPGQRGHPAQVEVVFDVVPPPQPPTRPSISFSDSHRELQEERPRSGSGRRGEPVRLTVSCRDRWLAWPGGAQFDCPDPDGYDLGGAGAVSGAVRGRARGDQCSRRDPVDAPGRRRLRVVGRTAGHRVRDVLRRTAGARFSRGPQVRTPSPVDHRTCPVRARGRYRLARRCRMAACAGTGGAGNRLRPVGAGRAQPASGHGQRTCRQRVGARSVERGWGCGRCERLVPGRVPDRLPRMAIGVLGQRPGGGRPGRRRPSVGPRPSGARPRPVGRRGGRASAHRVGDGIGTRRRALGAAPGPGPWVGSLSLLASCWAHCWRRGCSDVPRRSCR